MTQDSSQFLPRETTSRLGKLEIQAKGIVEGFMSGTHRSPYFGQSIEFVQHRDYVPGDDFRRIDWKVWSKTDKYYIKQYEEETNLRTVILLDQSESMAFQSGERSKYEFASLATAALSYLLLRQQDSVGLATFTNKLRQAVPIRSHHQHLHIILNALLEKPGADATDLTQTMTSVAERYSRRGLFVLLSDCFGKLEGLFRGLERLKLAGHDVMVLQTLDDQELDFDFQGTTKFIGMEQGGEITCDPKSLREGYLAALAQHNEKLKRFCTARSIDFETVRTSQAVDAVLARYLAKRQAMMKAK